MLGTIDESYVPILKGVITTIVFEQDVCWWRRFCFQWKERYPWIPKRRLSRRRQSQLGNRVVADRHQSKTESNDIWVPQWHLEQFLQMIYGRTYVMLVSIELCQKSSPWELQEHQLERWVGSFRDRDRYPHHSQFIRPRVLAVRVYTRTSTTSWMVCLQPCLSS